MNYFLYCNILKSKLMEEQNLKQKFLNIVNAALLEPQFDRLQELFTQQIESYRQVLFSCTKNYAGNIQKNIIITKVTILRKIYQRISNLTSFELNTLSNRLRLLTKSDQKIVKNQIIPICFDIVELKDKLAKNNLHHILKELLEQILNDLTVILRSHIVARQLNQLKNYSQYKQEIQGNKSFSQKIIAINVCKTDHHSDKNIKRFDLNEDSLAQISLQVKQKSIQQLLENYVQHEQIEMVRSYQLCRICLQNIKVQSLANHVDYCSKKSIYSNRINQIKQEKIDLIGQIQQRLSQNESFDLHINKQQKQVYKLIINFQRPKNPNCRSRNSSVTNILDNYRKDDQLQSYICFYNQKHPKDSLLTRYQQLKQQLTLLNGRLGQLQKLLISNNWQKTYKSSIVSYQSSNSRVQFANSVEKSFKTKKSIFSKQFTSINNHMKTSSYIIDDDQIKKFKSIKIAAFGNLRGESTDKNQSQKNLCKSLQNIQDRENQNNKTFMVTSTDFQFLELLGQGAFGKVYLGRRKITQDLYALKVIKIDKNWGAEELKLISNEHEIFRKISSDYLVTAPFSFTQGCCHFFVMEYVPGGDLGKILEQQTYFDQTQAKFYLAQIILAIQALHHSGIIHRDLKPQNLVIDIDGHLKLTDFGLSQIRISDKIQRAQEYCRTANNNEPNQLMGCKKPILQKQKKKKIIGTPDYIAPQIINQQSVDNQSIDWWSLGVIAYEMLIGCRPFTAETVDEVIDNIMKNQLVFPEIGYEEDMISPDAVDLIQSLLNQDYKKRLGAKDVLELKNHPFFKGIEWNSLRSQKCQIRNQAKNIEEYKKLSQDRKLKIEINRLIKNKQSSKLKLQKFVRYDLLVTETFDSAQKHAEQCSNKLKQIKRIASNFHISYNESVNNYKSMQTSKLLKSQQSQIQLSLDINQFHEASEEQLLSKISAQKVESASVRDIKMDPQIYRSCQHLSQI